ncbi:uncharacterized protein LOC114265858 isoform X3 [Camellia sinensis]|uniref:uncharacterized protein LOC114265858 isoform X3 n=1 Tax=Camellia sinensis TaxID=4442 RepID=UPI0010357938|nr:uncharacterized protein LOC114265858 isoform X3 [Camellia sinensis]
MLEKEVTPSSKVRADVVRSGFMNTQKVSGASDGCRDGNKVSGRLHRYEHLSRMAAIDESESLSDIDDVEVVKYLHSKEEMHYKKIIWEQMNRKHGTVRPRKRSTEAKKDAPARKASKTTDRVANEKRLSSRINYDALEKLNAELSQGAENAISMSLQSQGAENANTEGIIAKCDTKFNRKFSTNNRESERRKYDDEFDHRINYGEGVESCGDYDSALYYGHEEAGYACGVDYDYED